MPHESDEVANFLFLDNGRNAVICGDVVARHFVYLLCFLFVYLLNVDFSMI